MNEVYEAFLELNTKMLLNGLNSEFEVVLSEDVYIRFGAHLTQKFSNYVKWEVDTLAHSNFFKVPGPGGYITFRRRSKNE